MVWQRKEEQSDCIQLPKDDDTGKAYQEVLEYVPCHTGF